MSSDHRKSQEPNGAPFAIALAVTLVALVVIAAIGEHSCRKVAEATAAMTVAVDQEREARRQSSQLTLERDSLKRQIVKEFSELIAERDSLRLRVDELLAERDRLLSEQKKMQDRVADAGMTVHEMGEALASEKLDRERIADGFLTLQAETDALRARCESLTSLLNQRATSQKVQNDCRSGCTYKPWNPGFCRPSCCKRRVCR